MSKQTETTATETTATAPEVNVSAIQAEIIKQSHPAANLFPMMSGDEFENLVLSIAQHGYDPRKPIKKKGETITDGRNRAAAVKVYNERAKLWNEDPKNAESQKPYVTAVYEQEPEGNDAAILGDVLRENFTRRNMTQSQKAAVIVKAGILGSVYQKKEELGAQGKKVAGDIAALVAAQHGVNSDYIYKVKAVAKDKKLGKELLNAIARGEKSVMEAYKQINEVPAGEGNPQASEDDVLDGRKVSVPAEFRGVFAVREKFAALAKVLREARKLCDEIAAHEGGVLLAEGNNLKEAKAGIGATAKALRNCEPHAVCPHCEGSGKHEDGVCTVCAGVGFLTEPQFDNFEKHGAPKIEVPTEAPAAEKPKGKQRKPKADKPAEAPAAEQPAEQPAEAPAGEGSEPAPV